MAERLAHRDLRNRSAEILREVRSGAAFEITNHGEVVAVLSPPNNLDQADLLIRRAKRRGGFSSLPRARRVTPVMQSLDELRGDR